MCVVLFNRSRWSSSLLPAGAAAGPELCAVCSICCFMCMRIHIALQIGDFIGDELRFASEEGQLFHLPRDNHCEVSVLSSNMHTLLQGGCSTCPATTTAR